MEENRTCQSCKKGFVVEPEDFLFYEKINVPPPTFCPECRTIRRLTWRNEMSLYKRKCDAPGHEEMIVSIYRQDEKVVVYDHGYWWSDEWDPLSFGREYDFSKPFFEQWKNFRDVFPLQALSNSNASNSDYCNVAEDSRDSYMSSASWRIERTFYSNRISVVKDISDCYLTLNSELCYDDVMCKECYKLYYSFNCKNCVDSYFLYDCHGCTDCFGCTNLRNKSYCMWNEQLSREEYLKRIGEIDLQSYKTIVNLKQRFKDLCLNSIHRFATQTKVVDSTGDNIEEVKNCRSCFDMYENVEDSKFCHWALKAKDMYDCGPGAGDAELMYEVFDTGIGNFRNLFTSVVYSGNEIEYCFNCYGSSYVFGCIGLRSKKYCIFNKQYTKEEYEEIIPRIKEHMNTMPYIDKMGRVYQYGEFFPSELSPFCYNETVAQDYFPKNIESASDLGLRWHEKHLNEYSPTISHLDLQDRLSEVDDSIVKEIIQCEHEGKCDDRCAKVFRITPDELQLYRRLGVPLPRLCFGCRHEERLRTRNPMKLWHRQCMCDSTNHGHDNKCSNEFETAFSPDRSEKIYCEKCYQKEVI